MIGVAVTDRNISDGDASIMATEALYRRIPVALNDILLTTVSLQYVPGPWHCSTMFHLLSVQPFFISCQFNLPRLFLSYLLYPTVPYCTVVPLGPEV